MNPNNQKELLNLCFPRLYSRLTELTGRWGGNKVSENLKQVFLAHASGKGFNQSGKFVLSDASADWAEYRNLTSQLIEFTIGVAGRKAVAKEIQKTIDEIEKETGESLYETGFKLNLLRYLEK